MRHFAKGAHFGLVIILAALHKRLMTYLNLRIGSARLLYRFPLGVAPTNRSMMEIDFNIEAVVCLASYFMAIVFYRLHIFIEVLCVHKTISLSRHYGLHSIVKAVHSTDKSIKFVCKLLSYLCFLSKSSQYLQFVDVFKLVPVFAFIKIWKQLAFGRVT